MGSQFLTSNGHDACAILVCKSVEVDCSHVGSYEPGVQGPVRIFPVQASRCSPPILRDGVPIEQYVIALQNKEAISCLNVFKSKMVAWSRFSTESCAANGGKQLDRGQDASGQPSGLCAG